MKRTIAIALLLCLLLCGCKTGSPEQTLPDDTQPTAPTQDTQGTSEPVTESTEPTQPGNQVQWDTVCINPLTGEPADAPMTTRPFAVMMNNIQAALPLKGNSKADIFIEILAEGSITRCLGIFSDFSEVETLGSIRSCRPYFVHLAQSFDAIYVHAGGSKDGYSTLSSTGWDHIDGVNGSGAYKYYYRDQSRLSSGYALEHTMFIKPDDVIAYSEERGCTMTRDSAIEYGFAFVPDGTPDGETANTVTASFRRKTTAFTYSDSAKVYSAAEYGKDFIDGNTGEAMTFTNLLILKAATGTDSEGYRLYITLTGEGDGYFACGGRLIPIRWSREDGAKPFVFTKLDGTALSLGVGKTYIGITPLTDEIEYGA